MSSKYKVGDRVSYNGITRTRHGTILNIDPQSTTEYRIAVDDGTIVSCEESHLSPLAAMSSKFKPGDRIHKHGIRGTVRTSMIGDNDVWRYLIDFDNEWVMSEYIMEHELQFLDQPVKSYVKSCECGAAHTSFKDHHMFYCPLYKKN